MLLASLKGNFTYGSRTACFTFHALTPNETQLNSLLFNALLLNIFSTAILHLTCHQLNLIVTGEPSYLHQVLALANYTKFFKLISQYKVFSLALIIVSFFTLLILLIRGGPRLKFSELEAAMSTKKKGTVDEDELLMELE